MSAFLKNVSRCTRYLRNAPSLLPWTSPQLGIGQRGIGQRGIGRASAVSKSAAVLASTLLASTLAVPCCFIAPVHGQSESDEQYESYEEEMGMEDPDSYGYGGSSSSSYGGPGSGPNAYGRGASTQQIVTSRLSDALASALKSTSLESLTNPDAAPPVLAGPVLLNDATVAYAKGNYALAMRLYFGHIVAEYDSAQSQLQLVKYSALMKRPTWQLRWGVSYAVRGDATDPQPIGDVGAVSRGVGGFQDGSDMGMEDYGDDGGYDEVGSGGPRGGPRGAMRGRGSQGPSRGPVGSGPPQGAMDMDMQDYAYEEDMQDMYDGTMDMDMDMGGYGGPRRQTDAPVRPPTAAERLATLPLNMLSEEADQALQDNLGVVATILGEEFDKRYAQGDFGRAMTDVTPESGSADAVSEAFVNLMETTENSLPLWRPGIVFLGEGLSADNTRRAQKADLDLIIHFDILLKPLRGSEYTQNISRCRLIHVPSGKSLGVSKTIDSLEFATKSRAKSLASRDYVNEQLANFFEIMDRQTVTTELPSLTKEIVLKRIGTLLGSGGGANLRTLAEVRLFQSQNLLDEADVLAAFDIVGGEEALQLIFASEEERVRIVRKWAGGNVSETE